MALTDTPQSEDGDRSGRLAQLLAWVFWLYGLAAVAAYVIMLVFASRSAFAGVYLVVLGAPWSFSGAPVTAALYQRTAPPGVVTALLFLSVAGGAAVNGGILYYLAMVARGCRERPLRRGALLLATGSVLVSSVVFVVRLWLGVVASLLLLSLVCGGALLAQRARRC